MSKKLPTPHDSFVKNILGKDVYARDFIRYYLPKDITDDLDLDTLEVSSKSYVSDELKESLTDLVMTIQFKNRDLAELYFLVEHKSNLYRQTRLQILGYLNEVWQNKKGDDLPVIIPVVFYHGKKKWKYSLEFSDMFNPPGEHYFKHIPKFEHVLLEVPEINKQKIKSTIVLEVFNLTLEHIFYPDRRDRIYKAMEGYHKAIMEKPKWEERGELKNAREALIDIATEQYGPLPGMLPVKIKSIQSIENLRALTRKVLRTDNLEEFTELVNRATDN